MRTTLVCLALVALLSLVTCQEQQQQQVVPLQKPDVGSIIAETAVNQFTSKLNTFIEVFNVKLRFINLLASLWTPENLQLLRSSLGLVARFSNYVMDFIPRDGFQGANVYDKVANLILTRTGLFPYTTERALPDEVFAESNVEEVVAPFEEARLPEEPAKAVSQAVLANLASADDMELTNKILENYRQAQEFEHLART
ncbi:uncharacterized protein LOC109605490 [Aethina tumida]|uniref:uncharacterized protein LOC109605490 n=1 Tax=Aethina tumida TaxID=116153 RepID=UPI002147FC07|nr:uncharacterized protein LOC109605490 [Aethina tumida]